MRKTIFLLLLFIAFTTQLKAQQNHSFPKGSFDDFTDKWYSKDLGKMNEQVLFNSKTNNEIYRFIWLRSFDYPVIIRIEKHNNTYLLYWKAGIKSDKIFENKQKTITKANWDFFQYRLKQTGFWKLPTDDPEQSGADGAKWILEGKKPNQYHVTDRWTPHKGSDYYKCGDLLISLTDLKIPKDREY